MSDDAKLEEPIASLAELEAYVRRLATNDPALLIRICSGEYDDGREIAQAHPPKLYHTD